MGYKQGMGELEFGKENHLKETRGRGWRLWRNKNHGVLFPEEGGWHWAG